MLKDLAVAGAGMLLFMKKQRVRHRKPLRWLCVYLLIK